METRKRHHGYNVKRLREILGIKQEDLADRLQLSQQAVSKIEQRETLESELLEKIAKALNLSPETIGNFDDEATVSIVANTFNNTETSVGAIAFQYNFNPIDKIVELYEKLLQGEKEKVALLERLLEEKNNNQNYET